MSGFLTRSGAGPRLLIRHGTDRNVASLMVPGWASRSDQTHCSRWFQASFISDGQAG